MDTALLFNLTLIELLLTQNDNICFASHTSLYLDHSFFNMYKNFYYVDFMCQKAGSSFDLMLIEMLV